MKRWIKDKMKEFTTILISFTYIIQTEAGSSKSFWQVTDMHLDTFYSAENGDPKNWCHKSETGMPLGRFGDFRCDPPFELIHAAIKSMYEIDPNPDFILWTGDSSPHFDPPPDLQYVYGVEKLIVTLFMNYFPQTPILPVMGNHDTSPPSYFPDASVQPTDFYERYLNESHWKQLITDIEDQKRFSKCGFFKRKATLEGLTFLLLNTNIYYKTDVTGSDPCNQFQWMEEQLMNAENNSLFILSHVPPGYYERVNFGPFMTPKNGDSSYNTVYTSLIMKYAHKIYAQIYGHTHTDTFRLFTEGDPNLSKSAAFIAPSVTPRTDRKSGTNPSIRRYSYDPQRYLLDYDQYYMDLKTEKDIWRKTYTFSSAYDVRDLSVSSLIRVFNELENNPSLFEKYYDFNTALHDEGDCDLACKATQLCGISQVTIDGMEKCLNRDFVKAEMKRHAMKYLIIGLFVTAVVLLLAIAAAILLATRNS